MVADERLAAYASAGPLTRLDGSPALDGCPGDLAGIVATVRGVLIARDEAARLGVGIEGRRGEEQLRSAAEMVARVLELDPAPIRGARPPERRMIGVCRHCSVLTVALLRRAGHPARTRAGFASYIEPGRWIDHWIVERWATDGEGDGAGDGRWVRVDPQPLPDRPFDPMDVPRGPYLTAAEAWRLCRSGAADPALFGVDQCWGSWFIRNSVVRDLAALNRVELLPWDAWGLMDRGSALGEGPADALVDHVAGLVVADDWPACQQLYEWDDRLRAPATLAGA